MDDVDRRARRFADSHRPLRRNLLCHNWSAFSEILPLERAAPFGHHTLLPSRHDAGVFTMQHSEKTSGASRADELHVARGVLVECWSDEEDLQGKAAIVEHRDV